MDLESLIQQRQNKGGLQNLPKIFPYSMVYKPYGRTLDTHKR